MLGAVTALIAYIAASAATALELAGEAGNVQRFICKSAKLLTTGNFCLHIIEGLFVDNGLVGIFHIEPRQFTTILFTLLGQWIFDVFLLQQKVAGVGYIRKDHFDVGIYPALTVSGGNAFCGKFPLRLKAGFPIKEVLEDASYNGGFFRYNDQLVAFPAISEYSEVAVGNALLHAFSGTPFYIVAETDNFFLCKGGQQCQHDLAITGKQIDVFFFKADLDAQFLQVTDGLQKVHGVSCKAGDGLGKDNVDFAILAVLEQSLKFCSC